MTVRNICKLIRNDWDMDGIVVWVRKDHNMVAEIDVDDYTGKYVDALRWNEGKELTAILDSGVNNMVIGEWTVTLDI